MCERARSARTKGKGKGGQIQGRLREGGGRTRRRQANRKGKSGQHCVSSSRSFLLVVALRSGAPPSSPYPCLCAQAHSPPPPPPPPPYPCLCAQAHSPPPPTYPCLCAHAHSPPPPPPPPFPALRKVPTRRSMPEPCRAGAHAAERRARAERGEAESAVSARGGARGGAR